MLIVCLIVSRDPTGDAFRVVSDFALDCTAERPLTFVFTARGDPSVCLHTLHVTAAEVITTDVVEMPLPIDPEIAVDVLTSTQLPRVSRRGSGGG